jgi:hypothetical protein
MGAVRVCGFFGGRASSVGCVILMLVLNHTCTFFSHLDIQLLRKSVCAEISSGTETYLQVWC